MAPIASLKSGIAVGLQASTAQFMQRPCERQPPPLVLLSSVGVLRPPCSWCHCGGTQLGLIALKDCGWKGAILRTFHAGALGGGAGGAVLQLVLLRLLQGGWIWQQPRAAARHRAL